MLNLSLQWLSILLVLHMFLQICNRYKEESITVTVYFGGSMSSTNISRQSLLQSVWPGQGNQDSNSAIKEGLRAVQKYQLKKPKQFVQCIRALICAWGFELCKPFWIRRFFSNANHLQEVKADDLVWRSFTTLRATVVTLHRKNYSNYTTFLLAQTRNSNSQPFFLNFYLFIF